MNLKKFLLVSDADLWQKFTSKIPRGKSINTQLIELMEEFTNES